MRDCQTLPPLTSSQQALGVRTSQSRLGRLTRTCKEKQNKIAIRLEHCCTSTCYVLYAIHGELAYGYNVMVSMMELGIERE